MNRIEWFNLFPTLMSSIAAIAAAIAAFAALRISQKANSLNEKSLFAVHHNSAVSELSTSIYKLRKANEKLSKISNGLRIDWSREIESRDTRSNGGENPRPLRHVLSNGSEMLAVHSESKGQTSWHTQRLMFSIVRDGVNGLNEIEYNSLLKKADGSYTNFEGVFGAPSPNENLCKSEAFRWVCYQLKRRVKSNDWQEIWNDAWAPGGWITRYQAEFLEVQPIFEDVLSSLREEKNKVAHSVLPLESNPSLNTRYQELLFGLEALLDDCNLKSLENYTDKYFDEERPQLVLYAMGMAYFVEHLLDKIYLYSESGDNV